LKHPPKGQALRQLITEKMHVERQALRLSPPAVRRRYVHAWAPVQHLEKVLRPCPEGLLRWWAQSPRGHLILTHLPSRYAEGPQAVRKEMVENVAYVCLNDLHRDPQSALRAVASLLDHLMGSHGAPKGRWLSDGTGVIPALEDVGQKVREYAALGYLEDVVEISDSREYFEAAFTMYLTNRRDLKVADPRIEKLLHTTILSESFWRRIASALPYTD